MTNAVFSIIVSPTNRICGSTNIVINIEIIVPRPRHCPIPYIAPSEVSFPISTPATASIVPEVIIVGNDKFIVLIMESFRPNVFLNSVYLLAMTIA